MRRGSGSAAVRSACKTSWNKCVATAGVVSNTTSGGAQSFMPRKRLARVTSGTRIPRITQEGLQPQPESTPGAFSPPPHPMAQSSNVRRRIARELAAAFSCTDGTFDTRTSGFRGEVSHTAKSRAAAPLHPRAGAARHRSEKNTAVIEAASPHETASCHDVSQAAMEYKARRCGEFRIAVGGQRRPRSAKLTAESPAVTM
jgi:hypothetical protein